jgi:hypothetical protein
MATTPTTNGRPASVHVRLSKAALALAAREDLLRLARHVAGTVFRDVSRAHTPGAGW